MAGEVEGEREEQALATVSWCWDHPEAPSMPFLRGEHREVGVSPCSSTCHPDRGANSFQNCLPRPNPANQSEGRMYSGKIQCLLCSQPDSDICHSRGPEGSPSSCGCLGVPSSAPPVSAPPRAFAGRGGSFLVKGIQSSRAVLLAGPPNKFPRVPVGLGITR